MSDQFKDDNSAHGLIRQYKEISTGVWAEVVALEAGSIGGGSTGLTDTQLRATPVPVSVPASVAVTGTFWQATQPVSIAATVTTDPSDRSARLLGHVTVDNQSLAISTKQSWVMFIDDVAATNTTETLQTISTSVAGAAVSTGTSYSVPNGKTLRITHISCAGHTGAGHTTAVGGRVKLRVNTSGAAIVTSPIQFNTQVAADATANGGLKSPFMGDVPDGLEFPAGSGIGVTTQATAFTTTTQVIHFSVMVIGFLY